MVNSKRSNFSVSGSSCGYAPLSEYNRSSGLVHGPPDVNDVSGYYVVPAYGSPGYNTLRYEDKCCTTYPSISHAYRDMSNGNCGTKYVKSYCQ